MSVFCVLFFISHIFTCGSPLTTTSEIFCNKNRTVLNKGDTLKYAKLAETLETIAEKGAESFYTGQVGCDLIQDVKDAGRSSFS